MVSRKYVVSSGMLDMSVTMRSSQTARPCTSTAPGFFTPLPVGSENDRLTCGFRRMLNAFCGSPMDVVRRKRPSGSQRAQSGHVLGAPSLAKVVNSHVR
jgi:hypothetical protein